MTVQLDSVIEHVENLPALPAITVRLIQVVADPDADIGDILEIVQYDQGLTGQVLRLCNSAYFGLSRRIGTLRDALAYLGSRQLMQLVLGVHCNTVLQKEQPGYGLVAGMLWRHSATVALTAEQIGKHVKAENPGILFTAGLLHDIGKVILGSFLAERYQEVIDLLCQKPITFYEAEKQVLGYSHAEVGELLANRWKLPPAIVAAARYHHEPDECPDDDPHVKLTVELIHASDSLALTMGVGIGDDGLMYNIDPKLVQRYQLTDKILEFIGASVLVELEQLEDIYNSK